MTQERGPIENLIDEAIKIVAKDTEAFFVKSEILVHVRNHPRMDRVLTSSDKEWPGMEAYTVRGLTRDIGRALQVKDSNGVRIYECYATGSGERRWLPLRAMTLAVFDVVIAQTSTQKIQMGRKLSTYQTIRDQLAKLEAGATIEQVYDKVFFGPPMASA